MTPFLHLIQPSELSFGYHLINIPLYCLTLMCHKNRYTEVLRRQKQQCHKNIMYYKKCHTLTEFSQHQS